MSRIKNNAIEYRSTVSANDATGWQKIEVDQSIYFTEYPYFVLSGSKSVLLAR